MMLFGTKNLCVKVLQQQKSPDYPEEEVTQWQAILGKRRAAWPRGVVITTITTSNTSQLTHSVIFTEIVDCVTFTPPHYPQFCRLPHCATYVQSIILSPV